MSNFTITDMVVFIPADRIEALCQELNIHPSRKSLASFLYDRGWQAETGAYQCEALSPDESCFADLDLEHDPLLEALVGFVPLGCFIRGYDDENVQKELRYHADRHEVKFGEVVFPEWSERKWFVDASPTL